MSQRKETFEIITTWAATITSFVAPFMSLLQFVAVCLAILVSLKSLTRNTQEKPRKHD